MPTARERNRRIANRFPEEVATEGRTAVIDEICAEDVVEYSPLGVVHGRDELKQASRYIQSAFTALSVTVEEAVADESTVAQRLTFRGTHVGEFVGVEPTGNAVEASNAVFSTVEEGLITERWLQSDVFTLMQQLGVVEMPGDDRRGRP